MFKYRYKILLCMSMWVTCRVVIIGLIVVYNVCLGLLKKARFVCSVHSYKHRWQSQIAVPIYSTPSPLVKASGTQPLTLKVGRFNRGIILRWIKEKEIILWLIIFNVVHWLRCLPLFLYDNNSLYLLSTYYISGTIVRAFYVCSHLCLTTTTWGRCYSLVFWRRWNWGLWSHGS